MKSRGEKVLKAIITPPMLIWWMVSLAKAIAGIIYDAYRYRKPK